MTVPFYVLLLKIGAHRRNVFPSERIYLGERRQTESPPRLILKAGKNRWPIPTVLKRIVWDSDKNHFPDDQSSITLKDLEEFSVKCSKSLDTRKIRL